MCDELGTVGRRPGLPAVPGAHAGRPRYKDVDVSKSVWGK